MTDDTAKVNQGFVWFVCLMVIMAVSPLLMAMLIGILR
jgi:hypothetical protein